MLAAGIIDYAESCSKMCMRNAIQLLLRWNVLSFTEAQSLQVGTVAWSWPFVVSVLTLPLRYNPAVDAEICLSGSDRDCLCAILAISISTMVTSRERDGETEGMDDRHGAWHSPVPVSAVE